MKHSLLIKQIFLLTLALALVLSPFAGQSVAHEQDMSSAMMAMEHQAAMSDDTQAKPIGSDSMNQDSMNQECMEHCGDMAFPCGETCVTGTSQLASMSGDMLLSFQQTPLRFMLFSQQSGSVPSINFDPPPPRI